MIPTIGTTNADRAVSTDSAVSVAARGQSDDSGISVVLWLPGVLLLLAITIGVAYFVYQRLKEDKETKNQQNPNTTTTTAATAATAANAANPASDDEYYYTDVGSFEYYYEPPSANVPKLKFQQASQHVKQTSRT